MGHDGTVRVCVVGSGGREAALADVLARDATEVLVTPDFCVLVVVVRVKSVFWRAFRRLGEWYDSIPPY